MFPNKILCYIYCHPLLSLQFDKCVGFRCDNVLELRMTLASLRIFVIFVVEQIRTWLLVLIYGFDNGQGLPQVEAFCSTDFRLVSISWDLG